MSNRNRFFNSTNPMLAEERFQQASELYHSGSQASEGTMTVNGAVNKSLILTALIFAGAALGWQTASVTLMWVGLIGGLIFGLIGTFKPSASPYVAPLYAVFEGLFLGTISLAVATVYSKGAVGGIVTNAIMLTLGTLAVMLGLYKAGVLRATEKFRSVVMTATAAVAMVYLTSMVLGFFGVQVPYLHEGGVIGIVISLVIVSIAALNLILDFDNFEMGEHYAAPKYMEWAAAMGLMFTLVWLYLEFLKLLMKLQSRD
jgi:uncharacterized YccA/Bax inhibitor family protein